MAWAAGTFSRAGGATKWAIDRDASTEIEAGIHDTHDEDLATGINSCINKDGSNAMTGDLNLGTSNKIINLLDPTADQDAATKAYVDTGAGSLILSASDEMLARLNDHTTIPAGFTLNTSNDNHAVKITGNAAAAADAGSINFDTALVNAHATVIANEGSHTHNVSGTTSSHTHTSSGLGSPGTSFDPVGSSHDHTFSDTSTGGTNHRHSITLAVKRREYHAIVKS